MADPSEKNEHTVLDDRNDKAGPFSEQPPSQGAKDLGSNEKVSQMRTVPRPSSLPNKPWEPAFKLKLNPPDYIKMKWARGVSVYSEMSITNNQATPQCYKMKCTDNSQFRVRPPMNFIDKGATVSVKIIHNSFVLPQPNKHYFAIYHVKCTPEDLRNRNFKRIWRPQAVPDGIVRVPVAFETSDIKISGTKSTKQAGGAPPSSTLLTAVSRTSSMPPVHGGRTKSFKKK